jgi:hypothetical protein
LNGAIADLDSLSAIIDELDAFYPRVIAKLKESRSSTGQEKQNLRETVEKLELELHLTKENAQKK